MGLESSERTKPTLLGRSVTGFSEKMICAVRGGRYTGSLGGTTKTSMRFVCGRFSFSVRIKLLSRSMLRRCGRCQLKRVMARVDVFIRAVGSYCAGCCSSALDSRALHWIVGSAMPPYLVQCSSKQCIAIWGWGTREANASSSEQKAWLWRTYSPIISPYFPASSVARWTPPRPASWAAWVRHEKPSARYTASGCASSVGSSECDATATDKS